MLRARIILLLSTAALVIFLFNLPRVVVDNDGTGVPPGMSGVDPIETDLDILHNQEISSSDQDLIQTLTSLIGIEENPEKYLTFADSLAELFLKYQKYDSAATYFEKAAEHTTSNEWWIKAGNAYYEAFTYAMEKEEADYYGEKVRKCFQPVLEKDPGRLDLKTKVGMTLVSSTNPMQGIVMLREVLEEDPGNEQALYNLGILAFQTGQYPTAIERFEKLIQVHDKNVQAHFYLGISYMETGQPEKARQQLLLVKELDKSPELQATVDSYLEEIN